MSNQENFWRAATWVGFVLTAFLVVMVIKQIKEIGYVGKSDNIINSISVSGKGEVIATPDVATFSFSVTETDDTVADAQKKATDKVNNALKVVRDSGVEDKDIQTLSYTINPHYEYQSGYCPTVYGGSAVNVNCKPGKNVLTGYDVSQTIQVKVRNLDKAGALFSSIGALNVQNVNGLNFSVDKPETVKAEARAKAIADAQAKANELAKQLGVKLVDVTSFYESDGYPIAYGMGGAADEISYKVSAAPRAPEVPAGEQKIVVNVNISYEIK